jgi:glucokinase
MEKRGRTRLTSAVWWHAIDRGDKLATKLIDRAVEALGAGIASAVNLLDVEAVIIGGGLGVRFGEPYVQRIAQAMRPHLFNDTRPPDVKLAALGDLGGALGAALLAKQAPARAEPRAGEALARAEPPAGEAPARAESRADAKPARTAPDAALPAQTP